jgi:hypothetical protein
MRVIPGACRLAPEHRGSSWRLGHSHRRNGHPSQWRTRVAGPDYTARTLSVMDIEDENKSIVHTRVSIDLGDEMEAGVRRAIDALSGVTRAQIRGTVLFGLGALAFTALINLVPFVQFFRAMPAHTFLLGGVIDFQIKAFVLLAAIVIAERAVDEGASRRRAYVLAAIGGCVLGVALGEAFNAAWRAFVLPPNWPEHRTYLRGAGSLFYHPTYALTSWLLLGAPAVFFYADRRAVRKTAASLHAAELDRIRRSRISLESRLQAMQARVEPQFLFNTLAQVERLYELRSPVAGTMLDDLIAYLRAAMPLMRDSSSTVGQEIELARRYLEIAKIRLGNRLTFDLEVPSGLADARMPPMMLLPLVDHAIVHGLEQQNVDGAFRITVEASSGRLRLTIADSGAGFVRDAGSDGMASIAERLNALYGDAARLELHARDTQGTEAVIEIPYEHAPSRLA